MGNREIKPSNKTKEEVVEEFSLRLITPPRACEPVLEVETDLADSGAQSRSVRLVEHLDWRKKMKPHESPRINKNQFVAIRSIRGLCGIGILDIGKQCRTRSDQAQSRRRIRFSTVCLQAFLLKFEKWQIPPNNPT